MDGKFSEFRESDKSLKYELGQFKDPVSLISVLLALVEASWSPTQEAAGSTHYNDKYFSH